MNVFLHAEASALQSAVAELNAVLGGGSLQLEGELARKFRQLFVDRVLDPAKLIRVDSNPAADGTGDVLVSFQPSDLFLDLLAALRAGDLNIDVVEAEVHGGSFRG